MKRAAAGKALRVLAAAATLMLLGVSAFAAITVNSATSSKGACYVAGEDLTVNITANNTQSYGNLKLLAWGSTDNVVTYSPDGTPGNDDCLFGLVAGGANPPDNTPSWTSNYVAAAGGPTGSSVTNYNIVFQVPASYTLTGPKYFIVAADCNGYDLVLGQYNVQGNPCFASILLSECSLDTATPTPSFTATVPAICNRAAAAYGATAVDCVPIQLITNTFTNTPTVTNTFTPTFTRTNTNTPTNTNTFTNTNTVTNTNTPTNTATNTNTRTNTNTPTETYTHTPTITNTIPGPTWTFTDTNTPTNTFTSTNTRTNTNTPTSTNTPTNTFTATNTFTQTFTPTNTLPVPTNTFTNTFTPTNTFTSTNTRTNTNTPTNTNSPTETFTPSYTWTSTNTRTNTNTPTETNTFTETFTHTFTATSTDTPTATNTFTDTYTSTDTPTVTPTPSVTPTTPPWPYVLRINIYNQAGELVRNLATTLTNNLFGEIRFKSNGKEVSTITADYDPANDLIIELPGVESPDSMAALDQFSVFPWNAENDGGQFVDNGVYYIKIEQTDTWGHTTVTIKDISVIKIEEYVELRIFNTAGELVRSIRQQKQITNEKVTLELDPNSEIIGIDNTGKDINVKYGSGIGETIKWDGKNSQGVAVASGHYEMQLVVKTNTGKIVEATKTVIILNEGKKFLEKVKMAPNPFIHKKNPAAVFAWETNGSGEMWIKVYGVSGELVRSMRANLEDKYCAWDVKTKTGRLVVPGMYIVVFEALDNDGYKDKKVLKIGIIR